MPIPDAPKSLPSLKYFLFQAYKDLQFIESNIYGFDWPLELTAVEKAVIILEDRRYFLHSGIDWKSGVREIWRKCTFRRHGGASTIDMQFVRTCTGYKEVTFRRKLYEMYLAWALNHRASKLNILRSYLNLAYFGSGVSGVENAAQVLFNRGADELNEQEAFKIASMLVYPRPLIPPPEWEIKINRRASYGSRLVVKHGKRYWS